MKNGAKSKMLKNTWTFEKVEMQIQMKLLI